LRIPYYVVYDRYENNLRVFKISGNCYEAIALSENRLWIENLGLGLGLWQGIYRNFSSLWLRWYNRAGWIPTLEEKAKAESQRAEAESQRANKLAAYLRSQGFDPDNLPV
jgi:hypothetical protein